MNTPRTRSSDNHQTEPIRPLAVARKRKARRQKSIPMDFLMGSVFCAVLIAIIVGGLWLYRDMTRPEDHDKRATDTTKAPSTTNTPAPPPVTTQSPSAQEKGTDAAARGLAQQRRNQFLEAYDALGQNGAQQWGGDGYQAVTTMGQLADRLWSEKRYVAAAEQYAAALAEAGRMVTEKDGVLEQTLISAHQALAQGDAAKATELFALAKLMDAENEAALNGLRRAQNYPEVQELIQTGKSHVAQGDLAAGKAAFESALALDPGAQAAREGLKEISLLMAEAQFKALVSEGLRAIERGDLATARSQLVRASQMQPENAAVKDAMARLEQSARVGEIKRLQQNALAAEAKENWEQALAFYLMALELDPNLQFAKKGRISTQDRIRINKRMRFYFENPDALAQDPQLQNAMALLDEAQRLTPRGPALATALAQLEATVAAATTPIKVILTSDGQTQVAVYKIGRLGRFKQHVLDLRPGTYTVVGSRDGYQDVRKQIVIKPKQDSVRIAIACSVKI